MSQSPGFVNMGTKTGSGIANTDQEQLIDMDEVYADTEVSQTEVDAVAEYLKTGKLSKEAAKSARVTGAESFEPGCTLMNGILGGESFLESMGQKINDMLAKAIKFITDCINWIVGKARSFTDFFSDNREVAKAEPIIRDIEKKLMDLGGPSFNIMDPREIFGKNDPSARRLQIVRSLRLRNLTVLEGAQRLNDMTPALKDFISELSRQENNVGKVRERFDRSIKNLRKRVKERSLTVEDVVRWEADATDMIAQNMQQHKLKSLYTKLAGLMADKNIAGVNEDEVFRESTTMMNNLMTVTKDQVPIEAFAQLASYGSTLRSDIERNPSAYDVTLDTDDIKKMLNMTSMDDLAFMREIAKELGTSRPTAVYQNFVQVCMSYANTLRQCVDAAVKFSGEVRYLAEWSQRYDVILGVYSLKSVKEKNDARRAYFKETGEKLNTAGLNKTPEDGMSTSERTAWNLYSALFPGLKKQMNDLSRKLNAGVQVQ